MNYLNLITPESTNNEFQGSNLSQAVFNKPMDHINFQDVILCQTIFNDRVNQCNFINASLYNAQFNSDITGFTCFSGADLTNVVFKGTNANTVIFIGSNLKGNIKGGIKTVSDLKHELAAEHYTDEDVLRIYDILSLAHADVKRALKTFETLPYHVNENHLDHIYQAAITAKEHIDHIKNK